MFDFLSKEFRFSRKILKTSRNTVEDSDGIVVVLHRGVDPTCSWGGAANPAAIAQEIREWPSVVWSIQRPCPFELQSVKG